VILAAEASDLLAGMAAAVPGVGACVVGADGEVGEGHGAIAGLRVRAVGDWF
jgi:hypothetical protein